MTYYTHKKISNGVDKKLKSIFLSLVTVIIAVAIVFTIVKAGDLQPPASPAATMYTLSDIYTRLTTNATSTEGDHPFSPSASPAPSMYTLTQIYNAIPTIAANTVKLGTSYLGVAGTLVPSGGTAAVADLFSGKTAHLTADWTLDTGTLNLACNTATFDGTGNLVADAYDGAGNGLNRWCMTDSGDAVAGNILSGKIAWVDGVAITGTANIYTYGDNDASKVLTTAAAAGTYNATNLTVGTVKSGTLFGLNLTGDYPSATYPLPGDTAADDAAAGNILSGLEAWTKAGSLLTGTMANVGQQIITPSTTNLTITAGYHDGTGYVVGDTDLVAGNIKSGINLFNVAGTLKSLLPDTGQTGCWDAAGTAITCGAASVGQDAEYTASNSGTCNPSFTDNGDETITDNCTNLRWQKCSQGLSGADCATGAATTSYWADALSYCEGLDFAGQTDWRLPNVKELQSIVNYQNYGPAINTTYFPATQSDYYWSGTAYESDPASAWGVDFGGGSVDGGGKDANLIYVRCVRQ